MMKRICGNCMYWNPNRPEPKKCKGCGNSGGRPNFLPRDMECAMCGAGMIYHKYEFLSCPDCGSQFWPFVDGGTTKDMVREEFEKSLPCERNQGISGDVIHVKSKSSGSKSSKGRSKKAAMSKPSTAQIYNELAASSTPAVKANRHNKILNAIGT